jgi:type II secretory pathway pseudopilin PulG
MMNRRGVTLLELLLAIALLLALGGLVLPALFDRMSQRAFEASAEIVRSQLLLARAHAQATGEPIEVVFEIGPPRVAARRFDADLATLEPREDATDEEALGTLRIAEPWADRVLADGVWIAEGPGEMEGEMAGAGVGLEIGAATDEAAESRETAQPMRLALYMPDGSAVLAETVWIRDEHGRRGRLTVNPWTGLPSFEQTARRQEEPQEPELLEEEAPEPFEETPEPEDEPAEEEPEP